MEPSRRDAAAGQQVRSEQAEALGRSLERRLAIANARVLLSLLDQRTLSRRAG
jgi:hypothetical protein